MGISGFYSFLPSFLHGEEIQQKGEGRSAEYPNNLWRKMKNKLKDFYKLPIISID